MKGIRKRHCRFAFRDTIVCSCFIKEMVLRLNLQEGISRNCPRSPTINSIMSIIKIDSEKNGNYDKKIIQSISNDPKKYGKLSI